MRILVTGGAGFIGSHIVAALLAEGHDVLAVDALLPAAHDGGAPALAPGAELRVGDLRDVDVARDAVAAVDAVCHQAAMVGLGVAMTDVTDYVGHNDLATAAVLRALAERRFRGRIVLASSMVVYGEGAYVCPHHGGARPGPRSREDLAARRFEPSCPACGGPLTPVPVPEDAPTDPRSVYAATKLHQEHLLRCFAREVDGVTATALRYHNVYGARMPRDTPYAGVAAIFRSALESGRPPRVFEDGGQLRDFVEVRDVARANVLALTAPEPVPGVFNIATGAPRSVLDMATTLAGAARAEARAPQVTGEFRTGDVRHVFAATARASRELGFDAEIGLEQGMRDFARAPLRG
jgi:dTDP-L-rhamnose 4-epimerase